MIQSSPGFVSVVDALRAAGEPTRLRLLLLLAREELSVMELVSILDQSQPRISRHLKLLTEAGLIERFPDGAWVFYRLSSNELRPLIDAILGSSSDPNSADLTQLEAVREARRKSADAYFESIAPQWDEIRSHYAPDAQIETRLSELAGEGPFEHLVDLGTGSGRMLALLGPRSQRATGIDLSSRMLNIARARVHEAGLEHIEFRHGDVYGTGLDGATADLVVIHQVLHFLSDPGRAITEAGRLLKPGGRVLIVDFAPHMVEAMREKYQHRRLGLSDKDMTQWSNAAGLRVTQTLSIDPSSDEGLTVRIWCLSR